MVAKRLTRRQRAKAAVDAVRAALPHQNPASAREVLENAIAVLSRPRGWTRHREFDMETGAACLLGALYIGDGGVIETDASQTTEDPAVWFRAPAARTRAHRTFLQARDAVEEVIPTKGITGWNDVRAKNKGQVIRMLQKALKVVSAD